MRKPKKMSGYLVIWVTPAGKSYVEGPYKRLEYAKRYAEEHLLRRRVWTIEIYHVDKRWVYFDKVEKMKKRR